MNDLLAYAVPLLTIPTAAAALIAWTYRKDRDEARLDLTIARGDIRSLTSRVIVLQGEKIAQQTSIDTLRTGHDLLVAERDEAVRALGRLRAENVAAAQSATACEAKPGTIIVSVNRDPSTGKFLRKDQKPAPISCG